MRAMYRIWGREGHRQKASWQKSVKFALDNGMSIETWCFDRTGTHDYVDVEITSQSCSPHELYDELDAQLDDGIFECCNYGKIERLKYSYFWSSGCPTTKTFNSAVATFETLLNNYSIDGPVLHYGHPGVTDCFEPVFYGCRFTARKRCRK